MVGVWEGLNLGSIPNDHMPSQKDPKVFIEKRCSTILPSQVSKFNLLLLPGQAVLQIALSLKCESISFQMQKLPLYGENLPVIFQFKQVQVNFVHTAKHQAPI